MARHRIPLSSKSSDMKSRRMREDVVNCYLEFDKSGEFKRLTRAPCFRLIDSVGSGPIRGMFVAGSSLYVASGHRFYKCSVGPFGSINTQNLGKITGSTGPVSIDAIGIDDPQVMVLAAGVGKIYNAATDAFTTITDVSFTPDYSVTSFNERFWLNRPNSNEFFASDVLDGLNYDPLYYASADNNPDHLKAVASVNTEVVLFGASSTERWYDTGATQGFSLRRIQGATLNRGIASAKTLAQWENMLFWLADDYTVRSFVAGGQMEKISDLALEQAIAGYDRPSLAFAFFVDYSFYKCYCITFPNNNVTWCYDVIRGLWHKRRSVGVDSWRIGSSANFANFVLLGDRFNGNIYAMDNSVYTEAGTETPMTWVTQSTNINEAPMVYSYLELVADMGVGSINSVNAIGTQEPMPLAPTIRCARSLDGGFSYKNLPDRDLGRVGNRGNKIIWRDNVRVPRTQDLVHKFEANGDFPVNVYSAFIEGEPGIV